MGPESLNIGYFGPSGYLRWTWVLYTIVLWPLLLSVHEMYVLWAYQKR